MLSSWRKAKLFSVKHTNDSPMLAPPNNPTGAYRRPSSAVENFEFDPKDPSSVRRKTIVDELRKVTPDKINRIRVISRMRPKNKTEIEQEKKLGLKIKNIVCDEEGRISVPRTKRKNREFQVHFALDDKSDNQETYLVVGDPMLRCVLCGYDCTIFAYGQTGSGKTHSLIGSDDNPGVFGHLVKELFYQLRLKMDGDVEYYKVDAQYIEVYNDEIFDLLVAPKKQERLTLVRDPETDKYVVKGCERKEVYAARDIIEGQRNAIFNRRTRSHCLNDSSSRSHMVIKIRVRQGTKGGKVITSILNIADLAGSECARKVKHDSKSELEYERNKINASLTALKTCMEQMQKRRPDGSRILPSFRDSKLTWLLQDSMTGKCKTTLLATISPSEWNRKESINTLVFATSTKKVKTKAKKNIQISIKTLQEENENLRKQLLFLQEGCGGNVHGKLHEHLVEEIDELKIKIENYKAELASERRRAEDRNAEIEKLAALNNALSTHKKIQARIAADAVEKFKTSKWRNQELMIKLQSLNDQEIQYREKLESERMDLLMQLMAKENEITDLKIENQTLREIMEQSEEEEEEAEPNECHLYQEEGKPSTAHKRDPSLNVDLMQCGGTDTETAEIPPEIIAIESRFPGEAPKFVEVQQTPEGDPSPKRTAFRSNGALYLRAEFSDPELKSLIDNITDVTDRFHGEFDNIIKRDSMKRPQERDLGITINYLACLMNIVMGHLRTTRNEKYTHSEQKHKIEKLTNENRMHRRTISGLRTKVEAKMSRINLLEDNVMTAWDPDAPSIVIRDEFDEPGYTKRSRPLPKDAIKDKCISDVIPLDTSFGDEFDEEKYVAYQSFGPTLLNENFI